MLHNQPDSGIEYGQTLRLGYTPAQELVLTYTGVYLYDIQVTLAIHGFDYPHRGPYLLKVKVILDFLFTFK